MNTIKALSFEEITVTEPEMATAILALLRARFTESLQGQVFRAFRTERDELQSGWIHTAIYVDQANVALNPHPEVYVVIGEHRKDKKISAIFVNPIYSGTVFGLPDSVYDSIEETVRHIAHHFRKSAMHLTAKEMMGKLLQCHAGPQFPFEVGGCGS